MPITKKDVSHVAELARLSLTEEETELYTTQLKRILGYVEKLKELETEGVEPTSYTVPLTRVMREDRVKESLSREDALKNAPAIEKGLFKVPQIIE